MIGPRFNSWLRPKPEGEGEIPEASPVQAHASLVADGSSASPAQGHFEASLDGDAAFEEAILVLENQLCELEMAGGDPNIRQRLLRAQIELIAKRNRGT
jgi:hypothetical protein